MTTDDFVNSGCARSLAGLVRWFLLLTVLATGLLTTGCASVNEVASDKTDSTAPDPEWYQSSDNVFHAD